MSKTVIRYHYNQRWVGWLGRAGITFGRHVFFRYPKWVIRKRLYRHEAEHVRQYARFRLFGQWWWTSVVPFLAVYLCQWVAAGFRWRRIRYEVEARAAERRE
jgi:hypothetical protein